MTNNESNQKAPESRELIEGQVVGGDTKTNGDPSTVENLSQNKDEGKALATVENQALVQDNGSLESFKSGVDSLLAKRDYFIQQVLP